MKNDKLPKHKYKLVTDPTEIEKYIRQGKYRDNLPHWIRNANGTLVG